MNNKVVIGGNTKLKNTISGQAKLNNVISGTPKSMIQVKGSGMTNAVKEALLDCFEHVAWVDDDGQVYYQALYDALYAKVLTSITAVFEQGQAVIYDDDTLDDLKQYLTVTANYDDGTSAVITTYTLSGTLNPGTSSIQVSYENKKAYFTVNVTHRPGILTITNTLNGCTTSNSDVSMTEGDPYSATITASSGYILTGASVSITMGGVDITSSAYSNGTISIAEVTGALVITITAVAVTLASISAVYTQSGTVYADTALNDLKTDLVVTATYSDSSTATVPSTDYTLSGTLEVGTSTVTVTYEGKTTTFNVTVSPIEILYFIGCNPSVFGDVTDTYRSISKDTKRAMAYINRSVNGGKKYSITGVSGWSGDAYPIPIPTGCTKVTISCQNLCCAINVHRDADNVATQIDSGHWSSVGGETDYDLSSFISQSGATHISVGFKNNNNTSLTNTTIDSTTVSITFS